MTPRPSAGGIVLNQEGKIVLVEQHGNSWSFPKGGIESGEKPIDAARREIFEETGLQDLTFITELGSYQRYSLALDGKTENQAWGLRTRTLFLFKSTSDELRTAPHDQEITKAQWFSVDEAIDRLTHPIDKAFLVSVRPKVEKAL